jgi:hypothetical protein
LDKECQGKHSELLEMACKHLHNSNNEFKSFGQKLGLGFPITEIQAAALCQEGNSGRDATFLQLWL